MVGKLRQGFPDICSYCMVRRSDFSEKFEIFHFKIIVPRCGIRVFCQETTESKNSASQQSNNVVIAYLAYMGELPVNSVMGSKTCDAFGPRHFMFPIQTGKSSSLHQAPVEKYLVRGKN